jgi:hypothetical protein
MLLHKDARRAVAHALAVFGDLVAFFDENRTSCTPLPLELFAYDVVKADARGNADLMTGVVHVAAGAFAMEISSALLWNYQPGTEQHTAMLVGRLLWGPLTVRQILNTQGTNSCLELISLWPHFMNRVTDICTCVRALVRMNAHGCLGIGQALRQPGAAACLETHG